MILFYFTYSEQNKFNLIPFQFHYDLILLQYNQIKESDTSEFQFHYDLILFFLA